MSHIRPYVKYETASSTYLKHAIELKRGEAARATPMRFPIPQNPGPGAQAKRRKCSAVPSPPRIYTGSPQTHYCPKTSQLTLRSPRREAHSLMDARPKSYSPSHVPGNLGPNKSHCGGPVLGKSGIMASRLHGRPDGQGRPIDLLAASMSTALQGSQRPRNLPDRFSGPQSFGFVRM